MPRALDVGTQVPHAALRAYVMGERGARRRRPPTTSRPMAAIVRGVDRRPARSASRPDARTATASVHGEPVPGTFAAVDELDALSQAMDAAGRGVFQVVPTGIGGIEGGDPKARWRPSSSGCSTSRPATRNALTFLVMESNVDPDSWRPWFEAVHRVNARGRANMRPQVAEPVLRRAARSPVAHEPVQVLADLRGDRRPPARRAGRAAARRAEVRARDPRRRAETNRAPTDARPHPRRTVRQPVPARRRAGVRAHARAERRRRSPRATGSTRGRSCTTCCSAPTVASSCSARCSTSGAGPTTACTTMMLDPTTVQGLGDGGAHSSIVCDASMTTYMLTHWVRDRTRGPRLPLEYAVKRLTSDPAELYGLGDRGVLAPGQARRRERRSTSIASRSATPSGSPTSRPAPVGWCSAPTATSRRSWRARPSSTPASSPTPARERWCGDLAEGARHPEPVRSTFTLTPIRGHDPGGDNASNEAMGAARAGGHSRTRARDGRSARNECGRPVGELSGVTAKDITLGYISSETGVAASASGARRQDARRGSAPRTPKVA